MNAYRYWFAGGCVVLMILILAYAVVAAKVEQRHKGDDNDDGPAG